MRGIKHARTDGQLDTSSAVKTKVLATIGIPKIIIAHTNVI